MVLKLLSCLTAHTSNYSVITDEICVAAEVKSRRGEHKHTCCVKQRKAVYDQPDLSLGE